MSNFIDHPKYGIIHNATFESEKECFASWNKEDKNEPHGFKISSDLLTLDRQIIIDHAKKMFEWVDKHNDNKDSSDHFGTPKERLCLAWQCCFGQYYGNPSIEKLNIMNKEELVYLILECESYCVISCNIEYFSMYNLADEHGLFVHKYLKSCKCHQYFECEHDSK